MHVEVRATEYKALILADKKMPLKLTYYFWRPILTTKIMLFWVTI
jgi:hypothetical protein